MLSEQEKTSRLKKVQKGAALKGFKVKQILTEKGIHESKRKINICIKAIDLDGWGANNDKFGQNILHKS